MTKSISQTGTLGYWKNLYTKAIISYFNEFDDLNKLDMYSVNDQKANILNNIGNAYRNLHDLNKALNYYQQALSLVNHDKHQLLRIYGNIGFPAMESCTQRSVDNSLKN